MGGIFQEKTKPDTVIEDNDSHRLFWSWNALCGDSGGSQEQWNWYFRHKYSLQNNGDRILPHSFFSLGAKSIIYAADMGCDVINMSWGVLFLPGS